MATFTMTLSEIMNAHGVDTIDDALPKASVFGLDKYNIFDESYRHILNRKIIARFWNREIGHETDEMFRMRMDTRMRELMVEKNQLYLSEQFKFDPMRTIDLATVVSETASGTLHGTTSATSDTTEQTDGTHGNTKNTDADVTSDSDSTKSAKSRAVSSVMPQNQLSGNGDYADSAQDSVSNGTDTSHTETGTTSTETDNGTNSLTSTGTNDQTGQADSSTTDKRDRTSTTTGMQALPSQLLQQYRDTILNIDLQILTELEKLFMSVTSNGDEVFYNQDQGYYHPYFNGFGFF